MFKKIPPKVHLSGGSVIGTGYPVVTKVEKGKLVHYEPIPSLDACPPLGSPEHYSLDAQLEAGIPIQEVNSNLLPPTGDFAAAFNKLSERVTKLEETKFEENHEDTE